MKLHRVARRGELAQGVVEYALIIALVIILCVLSVTLWGQGVLGLYSRIDSTISAAL